MDKHVETLSEILEHTETRCLLYEKRIRDGDAAAVHFLEVAARDAAALTYAIAVVEAAEKWAKDRAAIASILVDFGDAMSIDTANKALQVRHDSEIELFNLLSEEQKEAKPDA